MPEQRTAARAKRAKGQAKQAIAIGLPKARRAGCEAIARRVAGERPRARTKAERFEAR